jgi:hypothetical protein
MEIDDSPLGLQLTGPFDPSDGPRLLAAIQGRDVLRLYCSSSLSPEDAQALADLLRGDINPWLEGEDLKLTLVLEGSAAHSLINMGARLKGSRIGPVGTVTPGPG